MLVNITLNAATACMARAYTKRLDETQWPKTRPTVPRLRHIAPRQDTRRIGWDRDVEDFVWEEIKTRR